MDSLTIRFITRRFTDESLLYLYLRVSINGKYKDSALHRSIFVEKWDEKAQKMRGAGEETKSFNDYLQSVRTMVHNHFNLMLAAGMEITTARLFDRISGIGTKETTLLHVFKKHNDRMKALIPSGDFSEGTYRKYCYAYEKTENFIKHKYYKTDYELYKLNHAFVADFEEYLKVHDKIGHNTTMKYISNLKKIVNLCVASGWLSGNPFANFKLSIRDIPREQLTEIEMQAISSKKFSSARLSEVRDFFLFVCYTGLAYIDLFDLTWQDIQTGNDGKLWVIYNRHKNENRAPVPLLSSAQEILSKYGAYGDTGKVFPIKSNQKTNEYLKEIAVLCEINKNLHFHLGRHTFATTVTLSNGVPIETVGKMLGHKSLKSTQIYARVVDKKISEDMATLELKMKTSCK